MTTKQDIEDEPLRERLPAVHRALGIAHPEARCALDHANAFELLVATILSAQCTDERVNRVTPALFARYPDPRSLAAASQDELEELIRSTGFFRNKSSNLRAMAAKLVAVHDGEVPASMDALVALPGVARKTANVVLGNAFGLAGMPVDTHVGRIARRLGFTTAKDPVKIERELCAALPPEEWTLFSHRMIFHGRKVCRARTPQCSSCLLAPSCPSRD